MIQWLSTLAALSEVLGLIPSTYIMSTKIVTLNCGGVTLSSGLRHQVCKWHTDVHAGNTPIYINCI